MRSLSCLAASLVLAALFLSPSLVEAQVTAVPNSLNFQGRLATPGGNPVPDGTYSIRFSLHDALSAGSEKWNQTLPSVTVKNGTFAVSITPNSASLFDGNLWLEVRIGTDAPLTPRQPLVSVPYAIKSNLALTVPDGSLTASKFASGVMPTSLPPSGTAGGDLTGTFPNPLIASNAVTSSKLASDQASLFKVSAGMLSATAVSAASVDQSQISTDSNVSYGNPATLWQSFTPSVTNSLVGLDIFVWAANGSRIATLNIYEGEGVAGRLLSTQQVTLSGNRAFQYLPIAAAPVLTAGSMYTWAVTTSNIYIYSGSGDPYSGGVAFGTFFGGGDFAFRTYMQGLGRLTVGGSVGIGTNSPAQKLDVRGNLQVQNSVRLDATDGAMIVKDWSPFTSGVKSGSGLGRWGLFMEPAALFLGMAGSDFGGTGRITLGGWKTDSTREDHLTVTNTGNVGIGTSTPAYKLHVLGTLAVSSLPFGDYRNVQWNDATGQFYYDNSSRKHKRDITPLVDDFDLLLNAQPVTYTRPNAPGRWEIGFIAEDFDKIGLKKLVDYGKDGEVEGINYEKICLYLTEIAKKQQREIESLKAQQKQPAIDRTELTTLKSENTELRAALKQLAERMNALEAGQRK